MIQNANKPLNNKLAVENFITTMAASEGIDAKLLKALAKIESSYDEYAVRYEEHYKWLVEPEKFAKMLNITVETEIQLQKFSYGPLQLMGANFRYLGFTKSLLEASKLEYSVGYAIKHLKSIMKKYDKTDDIVAAYNAGSVRTENNQYVNQQYVDKFKKALGTV